MSTTAACASSGATARWSHRAAPVVMVIDVADGTLELRALAMAAPPDPPPAATTPAAKAAANRMFVGCAAPGGGAAVRARRHGQSSEHRFLKKN